MITTSLWLRLRQLTPGAPLQIASVISADSYGALVQFASGSTQRVRGSTAIGQKVFVRGGVIEGRAPDLPVIEIEI